MAEFAEILSTMTKKIDLPHIPSLNFLQELIASRKYIFNAKGGEGNPSKNVKGYFSLIFQIKFQLINLNFGTLNTVQNRHFTKARTEALLLSISQIQTSGHWILKGSFTCRKLNITIWIINCIVSC